MNLETGIKHLTPVARFAALIMRQVVSDQGDEVMFKLDKKAHEAFEAEWEEVSRIGDAEEMSRLTVGTPNAMSITYKVQGKDYTMAPAPGSLFGPVTRIFLGEANVPYWSKSKVEGEFHTTQPDSKWKLDSDDLSSWLRLTRLS